MAGSPAHGFERGRLLDGGVKVAEDLKLGVSDAVMLGI